MIRADTHWKQKDSYGKYIKTDTKREEAVPYSELQNKIADIHTFLHTQGMTFLV